MKKREIENEALHQAAHEPRKPEKLKEKKLPQICKDFLTYEDVFSIEARCEKLAKEILEKKKVKNKQ